MAIDLNEPGDVVGAIDVGPATVLVDADGAPRSIEIVGVDRRGAAEAITAVVARWPKLDRSGLLAAADAAQATPDREITVSFSRGLGRGRRCMADAPGPRRAPKRAKSYELCKVAE